MIGQAVDLTDFFQIRIRILIFIAVAIAVNDIREILPVSYGHSRIILVGLLLIAAGSPGHHLKTGKHSGKDHSKHKGTCRKTGSSFRSPPCPANLCGSCLLLFTVPAGRNTGRCSRILFFFLTGDHNIFLLHPGLFSINCGEARAVCLYTSHYTDTVHIFHLLELLFGSRSLYRTYICMSIKIEHIF